MATDSEIAAELRAICDELEAQQRTALKSIRKIADDVEALERSLGAGRTSERITDMPA